MYQTSPMKIWRKYANRYRLAGSQCEKCGHKSYPPVMLCPECSGTKLKEYVFPDKATLVTWSVVNNPPKGFEFAAPITVAIIQLEAGERITTQLVDCDPKKLKFGLKLKPVFRKIFADGEAGIIHYGLKFTPSE